MSPPNRLRQALVPVVIISCQVLQDMLTRLLPEGLAKEVIFVGTTSRRLYRPVVRRLVEMVERLASNAADALGVDKDFLVIPPGGEIRQESFMR